MKKNIIAMLLTAALSAALLTACGDDKAAEAAPAPAAEETDAVEEATEEVAEEVAEATDDAESDGSFTLLDVDENMVDVGAYGTSEDGTELVFTMFTGPDGNKYVSLFAFDNGSDSGDVICGQYEASTEKDDEGDEWTLFDVEDVYTGNHFNLGVCERPSTEEVFFFDEAGNTVQGKFLTSAETINYMGSAAALIEK